MFEKVKKYIYPLIFSVIYSCMFLAIEYFMYAMRLGMGGIAVLAYSIIVFVAIIVPIYCFIYGKRTLLNERKKYLFAIYNASVITCFYILPFFRESETYIYAFALFIWAVIWTTLPLLIFRNRANKQN